MKKLFLFIPMLCSLIMAQSPNSQTFPPRNSQKVELEASQLFLDTFNNGIDASKWTATAGGTGVAPTNGGTDAGSTVLSSGTTLNSFSMLKSVLPFQPEEPGYLYMTYRNNFESPILQTGYRFWGLGTTLASPTMTTPLVDAIGYDIATNGHLRAVTYAGTSGSTTTLNVICDLSGLIKDSAVHKTYIWFRGDSAFWAIDGTDTAHIVCSFDQGKYGPNINTMPLTALAISNAGTAVTLTVNAVAVGDAGRNGIYSIATDNPAAAILPIVSSSIESGHILKAVPGNLYAVYATTTATGLLMVFNSATVPGDGAVAPIECIPIVLNGSIGNGSLNFAPGPPEFYSTGISVAFSTGTNCLSKTASATALFHALVK